MSELVATSQQGLVGKYQPYQEYKDSGVEWLGNVPSHWTVTAVKRFASFTTGWTPPTGNDAYFGGEHLWANISDIGHRVLSTTAKTITDAGVRATRIKKSPKGSLLFSFKLSIGLVSIVGEDMYTNEAIATFLPSETFNISYMYWAAPLFIPQNAEENIYGAKLLNQERISNASFVLPTPKEQRAIAAFLDYETARIDRLIAQQQRLIDLLKEKRQAMISHAVTKGLNPDAPMKDSGVEWLGQVPEHWVSSRVGWCCQVGNGCTPSRDNMDYWSEGTYPWLNSGKVNDGYIISAEQFVTVTALKECSLPKVPAGSIVMAITGEGKTRGSVAMTGIDTTLSQHLAFITVTSKKLSPMYLRIWLESQYQRIRFESEGWGSTKAAITCSDIKSYPLPEPPLNEQLKIVEYVGERSKTFDLLIHKSESMISVLQERRTALISAAVTGKIDLRGWMPPVEEAAT
ncbi:restriction endonuclease subunit S [Aeromonas dhakensis]|uniref:restriction endonuclease subunit S n=1 Tax=Aeromonas TaxID=642 RepID=UPI001FCC50AE|nr:restriction endonuclease subunit S [Aeromonas dhakensis]MCJ2367337.1 restriction endonuclease subunit S [Aeromonas dhakensis]